ncbi:hypothetical protein [Salibacterium halotolerans]|uniref:Uncharacterized protein n=1 Tax=Salibacterium halotolerans TaxID=1884432 RepID=A0A1I5MNF8_9BACI|nr:hypothetical protein [Salibacterium halotolerans]SFP11144.1 hypothetical protein SAMN05518683_102291 [Salibacterium halotolerans]
MTEETKTSAAKKTSTSRAKTAAKSSTKETVIYIGPSIGNQLRQNSIFRGKLPPKIQEHVDKSAAVKALFVYPKDLKKSFQNLKKSGTKESTLYKKAFKYSQAIQKGEAE